MQKFYKRKENKKGKWTEGDLNQAVTSVHEGISVGDASRRYGIPLRTLKRGIQARNFKTSGMGPSSV